MEVTEQIDWWAKQPSQVACFSENLKCWEAWDISCGHKSQGHHTINCLEERGMERGSARRSLKGWGPLSIRGTLEPFQRKCWGNFWETGWGIYGLFWAHRYHLEVNSAELSWLPLDIPGNLVSWHADSLHHPAGLGDLGGNQRKI